jgi:hypothetical protein
MAMRERLEQETKSQYTPQLWDKPNVRRSEQPPEPCLQLFGKIHGYERLIVHEQHAASH